jgi:aprataxin
VCVPSLSTSVALCRAALSTGKSTFSLQLAAASGRAWRRVNQDTISKGGTRGTRQQCLAAAKAALAAGCNVIIDRCNVDAAQRSEFVLVAAAAAAPVHCLHLHLPTRVCIKVCLLLWGVALLWWPGTHAPSTPGASSHRVACCPWPPCCLLPAAACRQRAGERVNHEGGVSARDAPRVVNTMASQLNKAGPPAAAEGFTSITVAASDAAVAAQLQRWAAAPVGIATPQEQAAAAAAAAVAGQNGGQERPAKRQKSNEPAPGAAAAAAGGGAAGTQQLQQQTPTKQQHAAAAGGGGGAAAGASPVGTGGSSSGGRNAFSMLMAGAKQQAAAGSSKQAGGSIPPRPQQHQQHFGGGGGWSGALTQIAATPDRFRAEASIWHVDDRLVGLLDKYPKSSTHALLLSRQPALDRVTQLTAEHVPLLQHMRATALRFIEQQQEQQHQQVQQEQQHQQVQQQQEQQAPSAAGGDASSTTSIPPSWRVGFHSVPSMAQLHLHILSDDFDSEWLKTKKHWNSYTSAFFLPLDDVLAGLQRGQPVVVDPSAAEALLKQALACHRCGAALANMPKLKQHIASCAAAQT